MRQTFGRQLGLSLLEVMVAAVLLSLGTAGVVGVTERVQKANVQKRVAQARDRLAGRIQSDLLNLDILRSSRDLAINWFFRRCLNQAGWCDSTDQNLIYPVVLISANGADLAGSMRGSESQLFQLTGTYNSRRVVDVNGETCNPALINQQRDRCNIELFTGFRARCPGGAATCQIAETIELFYDVRQRPGSRILATQNLALIERVTNLPPRNTSGGTVVRVADINKTGTASCPNGQIVQGFNADGTPRCDWEVNPCSTLGPGKEKWIFLGQNPDGTFKCVSPLQNEACPDDQILAGVRADGSLDCRTVEAHNQGCPDGQILNGFDANGNPICYRSPTQQDCPPDEWLIGYVNDQPKCWNAKGGGAGYSQSCDCGHNYGWCNYNDPIKPEGFCACNPGFTRVVVAYTPGHCCASCGSSIGQWWCDTLEVVCIQPGAAWWGN